MGFTIIGKANFANREVAAVSAMKTLVSLAAGKYNYFVQSGGSILLGFVQKDKDLDPKVKEALLEQGKGMYIEPVDITSSGYGSAKMYAQLHPILMEAVNAADVIEAGTESFGITEDNSELNIPMFINSVIRYAYVNPVSNAIDKWIQDYERAKGKKEKDSKSNSKGNSNTSGSKGKNTP